MNQFFFCYRGDNEVKSPTMAATGIQGLLLGRPVPERYRAHQVAFAEEMR